MKYHLQIEADIINVLIIRLPQSVKLATIARSLPADPLLLVTKIERERDRSRTRVRHQVQVHRNRDYRFHLPPFLRLHLSGRT